MTPGVPLDPPGVRVPDWPAIRVGTSAPFQQVEWPSRSATCEAGAHHSAWPRLGFARHPWPATAPAQIDGGSNLTSVSCVSADFCVAFDDQGRELTFDGTAWSTPNFVLGLWGPDAYVSCASTSFCVAVASDRATLFDGVTWSEPVTIAPSTGGHLTGVSCPSTTFCAAVDSAGRAVTFDGASWSSPAAVFTAGLGGAAAVSCISTTNCVAVHLTSAATFDGTVWGSPTPVGTTGAALVSVTCPDAGRCVAVDSQGRQASYDGQAWTERVSIDGNRGLQAVSCASAAFCVAVDLWGHATTSAGDTWSAPVTVDQNSGSLSAVSCSPAAFCAAVDLPARKLRRGVLRIVDVLRRGRQLSAGQLVHGRDRDVQRQRLDTATARNRRRHDDGGVLRIDDVLRRPGFVRSGCHLQRCRRSAVVDIMHSGANTVATAGLSCPSSTFCAITTRSGWAHVQRQWLEPTDTSQRRRQPGRRRVHVVDELRGNREPGVLGTIQRHDLDALPPAALPRLGTHRLPVVPHQQLLRRRRRGPARRVGDLRRPDLDSCRADRRSGHEPRQRAPLRRLRLAQLLRVRLRRIRENLVLIEFGSPFGSHRTDVRVSGSDQPLVAVRGQPSIRTRLHRVYDRGARARLRSGRRWFRTVTWLPG